MATRDAAVLQTFFRGCDRIEGNLGLTLDKQGCDNRAYYPNGGFWNIDRKMREKGCSKYWKNGIPELAPEIWSVVPETNSPGKVGWTLDPNKITHWVVCTFDPSDTRMCYCLSFPDYRSFFTKEKDNLISSGHYRVATQTSGGWRSQCVFIPITVFKENDIQMFEVSI